MLSTVALEEAVAKAFRLLSLLGCAPLEPRKFAFDQAAIDAAGTRHQRARMAVFADGAGLQNNDSVEAAEAREPMRDRDHGAALHQAVERLSHRFLRFDI